MTTSTTPLTRERAWALLTEYTKSESLLKHAMAVEAAVRGYARRFGEDEEFWGITALLHDFDYERYPSLDDHPFKGSEILREQGYPEAMIRAILSHGDHTGVKRESKLEHTLFACDELAGFVTAAALVRPSKSVLDLEASSVKKRMKDKAFARAIPREDLTRGRRGARAAARRAHRQRDRVASRAGRGARAEGESVDGWAVRTRTGWDPYYRFRSHERHRRPHAPAQPARPVSPMHPGRRRRDRWSRWMR